MRIRVFLLIFMVMVIGFSASVHAVSTIGVTGVKGNDNSHFDYPSPVAVDGSGNIYVADSGNSRIQIFNSSGAYVRTITGFYASNGVAVDSSGNVYVADSYNQRIQIFDSNGISVRTLGETGVWGSDNSHFYDPSGVAVDGAGNIYVADYWNFRIQIFNSSGAYVKTLGVTGVRGSDNNLFYSPTGVTVDSTGNIYVVDSDINRIQVFNSSGVYIRTIGAYGTGNDNLIFPSRVAVDGAGNIYVADTSNNRIQIFNSSGVYIRTIGVTGSGGDDNSHFSLPQGVAVDGSNNLYVSDTLNQRIQIFDLLEPIPETLTIAGTSGNSTGTITGGNSINCSIAENGFASGPCAEIEALGTEIILTASPAADSYVTWTGCTTTSGNTCNVTFNSSMTIAASFTSTFSAKFADNGETMIDTTTGLEWSKDGGTPTYFSCAGGRQTWDDAFSYVSCLNANNYLGYNDWRLPNITELQSLIYGANGSFSSYASLLNSLGFSNVKPSFYWSSTAFAADSRDAWYVSMWKGDVLYIYKAVGIYIWPVRGGQPGTFGTLTIQKSGTGSGIVTSSPNGISCGSNCSNSYSGLDVSLTTIPDPGSTFSGWSGDAGCSGGTVTMTDDINCKATFTLNQYALTVNKNGVGNGTVGGGGTFDYDTSQQITAVASTGSTFTGWSGDCTGSASPLSVTILNRNMTCTATFIITVPSPPIVSATTPTKNTKPVWSWVSGGNGGKGTFRYRLDNPVLTTGATTTTVRSYTPVTLLRAGSHTLYVQERNSAGLWSDTGSMTVLIDTTTPVTTNNAPSVWVNSGSVTVTLNATDNAGGSGVATTKYCSPSSTCIPATVGNSITLTCASGSVCSQTVRYSSTDNAGNVEATKSVLIRQDLTQPKDGTMSATPGSGKITLTWTAASDTGSGLAAINKYKVVKATGAAPANCSGTALYTGNFTTYTDTAVVNGQTYGYRVCATDTVGNVSTGVSSTALMPSITVISPNGGEILTRGSSTPISITWNYTGNPGTKVKIDLYKDGVFNRTLNLSWVIGTGGYGSYNWTIPPTQTPGSDYTVKVTSTTMSTVNDLSDKTFTIN